MTAGKEYFVDVELRTNENKRYNGVFDINNMLAEETVESKGDEKLAINWYTG